jgi:Ca-activated chloride channel family protein
MAATLAVASAVADPAAFQLTVTPQHRVLPKDGGSTIVQVELKAPAPKDAPKVPINLAVVLDRSGSMAGVKLEKARQAAGVLLDQLGGSDRFSLVVYDDAAEVLIPPQTVEDAAALKKRIAEIRDGGGTALHAGVEKGAAQLRKYLAKEAVNRVILLSDGNANVGPSSPGDLARLGKELRAEGIHVSTVGLGDDYNEDLMTALAEASHANYYYVQDVEKLPRIFSEELGTAQSVVARNVTVTITFPAGVKPRAVLGEDELRFEGQSVRIPLSDIHAAQMRRFLVSCDTPAGSEDESVLAEVALTYDDAASGRSLRQSAAVSVQRSAEIAKVEASLAPDVLANRAITENRIAKEKAVQLADSGKPTEAAAVLQRQAAANRALPAAAQSPLLQAENDVLKNKAEELERTGNFSKTSRKEVQYQNYQDKKQKR